MQRDAFPGAGQEAEGGTLTLQQVRSQLSSRSPAGLAKQRRPRWGACYAPARGWQGSRAGRYRVSQASLSGAPGTARVSGRVSVMVPGSSAALRSPRTKVRVVGRVRGCKVGGWDEGQGNGGPEGPSGSLFTTGPERAGREGLTGWRSWGSQ